MSAEIITLKRSEADHLWLEFSDAHKDLIAHGGGNETLIELAVESYRAWAEAYREKA